MVARRDVRHRRPIIAASLRIATPSACHWHAARDIVGQAYCCYCYCSAGPLLLLFSTSPATHMRPQLSQNAPVLRFLRFSREFEAISSDFEVISSDFERLAHRIRWKTKRFAPSRPNVGEFEPSVGLLLFTRPTVHQCCSPGPLLFCCYC